MTQSTQLVSVVVPVFKKEDTLSKCINSILSQSYEKIEIILIDDGSPDNCGDICDEYALYDDRIKVFHQENKGVSAARDKGVELAQGDLITFVDADDILASQFIEKLMSYFDDTIDVVVGKNRPSSKNFKMTLSNIEAIKRMFLDDNFGVNVWGKLYRKKYLNKEMFPLGIKMGEDMYALFHVLTQVKKVVYVSDSMYIQQSSEFTSYNNVNIAEFYSSIKLLKEILSYVKKNRLGCEECIDMALVKRCIWLINIMCIRNDFDESLYDLCLMNVKDFVKQYSCRHSCLSLKYKIAILLLCLCPKLYLRLFSFVKRGEVA